MRASANHSSRVPCPLVVAVFIGATFVFGSCSRVGEPTTSAKVSFAVDIKPLLSTNCIICHNGETLMGGLNLESRDKAFQTTANGTIISPRDADQSLLYTRTATKHGRHDGPIMPADGILLSDSDRELLKRWIDQGAEWPDGPEGTIESLKVTPGA